jgi:predicted secreted hydrolase
MKSKMMCCVAIAILGIAVACAAKNAKLPPLTLANDQQFYKDEGAHFEFYYEQWIAEGTLKTADGRKLSFAALFNKAGSQFMQVRNGYNFLRLPDGRGDYRSFGQGVIKVLVSDLLKQKIQDHPDDKSLVQALGLLDTDKSTHFKNLPDGKYPLYRGRLFMNFGDNRFERISKNVLLYDLDLKTWAGMANLKLKAKTDPLTFDSGNLMLVSMEDQNRLRPKKDVILGYAFPRVSVTGTVFFGGKKTAVAGDAMIEHWWGIPDGRAMVSFVSIFQRLDNGGAMFIMQNYDFDQKLRNSHLLIQTPDGQLMRNKPVSLVATKKWESPVSYTKYETAWKVGGGVVSGTVKIDPGAENSELMFDRGVGTFLIAPCSFDGKVGKNKPIAVKSTGFCRIAPHPERQSIHMKVDPNAK